ncbi:response regulator [Cohnella sp. 56]|uniref:response regulator n=1 Tax=Cohnella sp. 56 TaxID=3113722 RepID=UPI0030EADC28
MTQVLIVDDEVQIANGIAAQLAAEELGIGPVHKAYSAAQALALLAANAIGVVVTDIRMPEMDGIALLRAIKAKWPRTKVILLTGYADFEYARTAIREEATDYLLKPVRKEALADAVGRALAQSRLEWEEISSAEAAMRTLRGYMPELKGKLLADLTAGLRYGDEALRERLSWFELPHRPGDRCLLLLVRTELPPERCVDANGKALLEYGLENIAHEIFRSEFACWCCRDAYRHLVFLLSPPERAAGGGAGAGGELAPSPADDEALLRAAERCAVEFHAHAERYLRLRVTVYIGPLGEFPGQVQPMYERALSAVRRDGARSERYVVRAGEPAGDGLAPGYLRSLHEPPRLRSLLEIGDWDAARDKLTQALDEIAGEAGSGSEEQLAEVYHTFAAAVYAHLHKHGRRLSELLADERQEGWSGSPADPPLWSAAQLSAWAGRVLDRLREQAGGEQGGRHADIAAQLQQFAAAHLSEDLSLQRLADHVFMHPTHLSKIYKRETGEGISEYIARLRMERAAELLGSTDERIYEIGCKTGYMNANYFIKVFRKQYGATPQEYRERMRRGARMGDS